MASLHVVAQVILLGGGATLVMDMWMLLMKTLKVPTLNFAFVGRWVGHACHGQFTHRSIALVAPVRGEVALGWIAHYVTGIVFALLLVGVEGVIWLQAPTLVPALVLGIATVAVPLFLIQPAMGAGFASSKTSTPGKNCLRSVISHAVFGVGLYLAGVVVAWA